MLRFGISYIDRVRELLVVIKCFFCKINSQEVLMNEKENVLTERYKVQDKILMK